MISRPPVWFCASNPICVRTCARNRLRPKAANHRGKPDAAAVSYHHGFTVGLRVFDIAFFLLHLELRFEVNDRVIKRCPLVESL